MPVITAMAHVKRHPRRERERERSTYERRETGVIVRPDSLIVGARGRNRVLHNLASMLHQSVFIVEFCQSTWPKSKSLRNERAEVIA